MTTNSGSQGRSPGIYAVHFKGIVARAVPVSLLDVQSKEQQTVLHSVTGHRRWRSLKGSTSEGAELTELAEPQDDLALALYLTGVEVESPTLAMGSLMLDGKVRPERGVLCTALLAKQSGAKLMVASRSLREASQIPGIEVDPMTSILAPAKERIPYVSTVDDRLSAAASPIGDEGLPQEVLVSLIQLRKRELRRVLLVGHPGSGKTMIARRLAVHTCSEEERLESSLIHSRAGLLDENRPYLQAPPLRAPHHTCSTVGMLGNAKHPGEVSLSHGGTLFLDELPEFARQTIEAVAVILREGKAIVHCSGNAINTPARPTMIIAAANPCSCGWYGHAQRRCGCPESAVKKYQKRLEKLQEMLGLTRVELT